MRPEGSVQPDKCLRLSGLGSADGQHRDLQGKQAEGVRRTERRPVTRKKEGKVREKGRFCRAGAQGKAKTLAFLERGGSYCRVLSST